MTRDDLIALKIVNKAMLNIKSYLEPLSYAINILDPQVMQDDSGVFATDGSKLYFNSRNVIRLYEQGKVKHIEYQIIHILLHGILGHFSDTNYSSKKLAWRVMDLQVEQIMGEIGLENDELSTRPQNYKTVGMSLYHQSLRDSRLRKYALNLGLKRIIDDHELWWNNDKDNELNVNETDGQNGQGGKSGDNSSAGENMIADKWKKAKEYLLGGDNDINSNTINNLKKYLKEGNNGFGSESGSNGKCAKSSEKRYSFYNMFKEFLQNKTTTKDQPDYIDQMLYQYGLDMYENIPLIEPLDEIEEVRLSNMVIAIDTSGSCEEYIGLFLDQIISIFRDISTHFHFEKIFLMQCDSSIKNVCEFSEIEELKEVNGKMKMYGFGGTSFTPVFRWIEKNLLEKGEEVDCLLYLSDGEGNFPANKPDYPVYFIFPEEEMHKGGFIPSWVNKVTLD